MILGNSPVLGWAADEPRRVCDACIKPIEAQLSQRARAEPVMFSFLQSIIGFFVPTRGVSTTRRDSLVQLTPIVPPVRSIS
jgi:hypothetical protein